MVVSAGHAYLFLFLIWQFIAALRAITDMKKHIDKRWIIRNTNKKKIKANGENVGHFLQLQDWQMEYVSRWVPTSVL